MTLLTCLVLGWAFASDQLLGHLPPKPWSPGPALLEDDLGRLCCSLQGDAQIAHASLGKVGPPSASCIIGMMRREIKKVINHCGAQGSSRGPILHDD